MGLIRSQSLLALAFLVLAVLTPLVSSLKFDVRPQPKSAKANQRCIRNFVSRDQLVVVTAIVSGSRGDGQMLNMHVGFLVSFIRLAR